MARHSNIQLAILFGSQASGKTGTNSDIDIAILADEPLTPESKTNRTYNRTFILIFYLF